VVTLGPFLVTFVYFLITFERNRQFPCLTLRYKLKAFDENVAGYLTCKSVDNSDDSFGKVC